MYYTNGNNATNDENVGSSGSLCDAYSSNFHALIITSLNIFNVVFELIIELLHGTIRRRLGTEPAAKSMGSAEAFEALAYFDRNYLQKILHSLLKGADYVVQCVAVICR